MYSDNNNQKTQIMKDARYTIAKNVKVGDKISFIKVPYFQEYKRLYWIEKEVTKIEFTKSGKRLRVYWCDESNTGIMSENTLFEQSPEKFWQDIINERGWI